ncbi:glucose-6-phosphate isomerase [Eimeria tenella]|uniref:Glucose-6-phosphate isomerase n=2 Tax=Eimeria tenella TaxID=5802 RepID=C8TDU8_EIMTE|nr:glucose-6-phosphate isomerase [Eimeria tenella]ADI59418.1 glucose-6-phosphate isomerase [Eimeria tenella]CAK51434.1 glucose-6-phosphate isomerase [Eimeria tenella]
MSSQFAACKALKELQHQKERNCNLRELIKDDERNQRMYREFGGACMDFSRQLLDKNGLDALMKLAEERQVEAKVKAMFQGDKINSTEQRRVLHVALRAPKENKILLEGNNIIEEVHSVLRRIKDFSNKIRSGELRGATGAVLKNLICVGIGGSYLGTEFVVESLRVLKKEESKGRQIRFLANVDPTDVARSVEGLSPEETLVLIISKTFTTAETILNARSLKHWLLQGIGREDQIGLHLCAVSTNLELTAKFGIQDDRVFGFWDWVGGRFSVTSAVGVLPLAIHYGYDVVEEFLKGCHAMDQHFLTAPVSENLPMLMGLCSVFNSSVLGLNCVAVLPYSQAMHRFAAHIQQLTMESNGKGVDLEGNKLEYEAGEIYFGEPGTNGQHSFYQLLHQGRVVPAEFIGFQKNQNPITLEGEEVSNQDELMSNFFAQPDALAFGKTKEELKKEGVSETLIPHKTFQGNRPSTMLLLPECNPYYLGMLLSLYENRVATEGFIWGINSFDQWGVELGKVLAKDIRRVLSLSRQGKKPDTSHLCSPTQRLLQKYLSA